MILLLITIISGVLLLLVALQQIKASRDAETFIMNYNNKTLDKNIDAVVTWVDTTDPVWIAAYNYNTGKKFQSRTDKERWTPQSADPEAELSTCLELIPGYEKRLWSQVFDNAPSASKMKFL